MDLAEVQKMQEEIREIRETLIRIDKSCNRMDRHVSFVEAVYEKLKIPLNYILNKVSAVKYLLPLSPDLDGLRPEAFAKSKQGEKIEVPPAMPQITDSCSTQV